MVNIMKGTTIQYYPLHILIICLVTCILPLQHVDYRFEDITGKALSSLQVELCA